MEVHYVHHPVPTLDIGPHVFPVDKYAILNDWLRSEVGVDDHRWHEAGPVDRTDLERVHEIAYVDDLVNARRSPRTLASELPIRQDVIAAFLDMAGGAITTAELALDHGLGFHLGGGLHHAFADHAEGFCYVNDVAVAIGRIRSESRCQRVLIVDVDVHQGNGTAAIFREDPTVFTYSIHQENNYPVKQRSDLDRGLPDGIADGPYLDLLAQDLDSIDARFEPDLVWYLAGVDPHIDDQLGGLSLTAEGLRSRDDLVLGRYVQRGLPVSVSLAGGYAPSPTDTARLHMGTVTAAEALRRGGAG
ncbi:MAG: histone deacetylase [Gemmatimonadetes bacterium]|nr:histone deacetylase [Gemmatimonadota bacterium]